VGKSIRLVFLTLLILLNFTSPVRARPLNICTHLGFEPFVIQNGKTISGIDVDVIVKALSNVKQSANITALSWKQLIENLKDGTCDIAFSLFDTEDRRSYLDYIFSVPIHFSSYNVFMKKGRKRSFNSVSDFFDSKIGHMRGFALTHGLEMAINDGRLTRIYFDEPAQMTKALETGEIDAIIANELSFKYYLKKHSKRQKFDAVSVAFLPYSPTFLVMSKKAKLVNRKDIKKMLETELKRLHLNGTILDITKKYVN
jgi:polar amino acid transport system substrate-binding protein